MRQLFLMLPLAAAVVLAAFSSAPPTRGVDLMRQVVPDDPFPIAPSCACKEGNPVSGAEANAQCKDANGVVQEEVEVTYSGDSLTPARPGTCYRHNNCPTALKCKFKGSYVVQNVSSVPVDYDLELGGTNKGSGTLMAGQYGAPVAIEFEIPCGTDSFDVTVSLDQCPDAEPARFSCQCTDCTMP